MKATAWHLGALVATFALLAGCATPRSEAQRLAQEGQHEAALQMLTEASRRSPSDTSVLAAMLRQRSVTLTQLANNVEQLRLAGQLDEAQRIVMRMQAIDATHARTVAAAADLDRARRHESWMQLAEQALGAGRTADAETWIQRVQTEAPGHPGARGLANKMRERTRAAERRPALAAKFQQPVSLEFREAPLRSVLEGMARTHGVNFVFDKDVRGDARVTVHLREVSIDEALRVLLSTQQLDQKLLNDNTVLIYPNTAAKQREHQELVTRNFYLVNADVKQAQTLIRTIAKTRDLFIDERLNLLIIRDTPDVVRLAERLVAGLDLPEPEVMLELEVMEISSRRFDELGLQWPEEVRYGLPAGATEITRADRGNLRASIANPALVARLREVVNRGDVLANPRLRARNREKAKVLVGEKLPVFTTTSTANVGVSAAVTYLDVGLKLEIEPTVQLDNDVVMRVNLEVSTLLNRVLGPQGSVAYEVGTRQATTSLRLRDGETQILAGLIRDEDSKGIEGLPVLSDLPVVGRLFGVHTDTRVKNEVVLLITPRVLRNIGVPELEVTSVAAGVDASPGSSTLRLRSGARVGVGASSSARGASAAAAEPAATPSPTPNEGQLLLATTADAVAGGTASVTLQNRSPSALTGELVFDPALLQPLQADGDKTSGRLPFTLSPGTERVVQLRVLPAAAGQTAAVTVSSLAATRDSQAVPEPAVQGDGAIRVKAAP